MDNLPLVTDSLDGIDEKYSELYSEQDGKFVFQTPDALLRAKQREKDEKQRKATELEELTSRLAAIESERETERQRLKEEQEKLEREKHRKSGDLEALEKSYEKKIEEINQSHKAAVTGLNSAIEKLTVDTQAQEMAARLAGERAGLLLPHIRPRLKVEMADGLPKVKVLDLAGNLSASSVADLEKEIDNTETFYPLLTRSKGSGGGANGSHSRGGGASGKTMTRSEYEAIPLDQRPNLRKEGITLTD